MNERGDWVQEWFPEFERIAQAAGMTTYWTESRMGGGGEPEEHMRTLTVHRGGVGKLWHLKPGPLPAQGEVLFDVIAAFEEG